MKKLFTSTCDKTLASRNNSFCSPNKLKVKFSFNFLRLTITGLFLLFTGILFSQTAPVTIPSGGFKIDGYLRANVVTAGGDWVPQLNATQFSAGIDNFVLNAAGTPKDPVTTKLQRDEYNNTNDDIFTQGSKFNDYISALRHGTGGAPNKNDIHNGVFHASGDADGNQWVFIGGDRLDVSGTSYIDFQFLQSTIATGATTFTGGGLQGGRTIGDINISMEYNNGGTAPKVVIYRWAPTNEAGTAWGWDSTGSSEITGAYAKTNLVSVDVPFGGFGAGVVTYQPFAFVEAAINITELITAVGGNCAGLNIKTLWITTKASSSSTAALKDYMAPISLDLNFGGVTIDAKGPICLNGGTIALTAQPSGGTFSGPGVSGSTFTPTASDAGVGTHTIVYTASAGVNCTKTASMQIVVRALPTASISGTTAVCKNATSPNVTFTGGAGTAPYTFTYNINGGTNSTVTTSSGNSVTVAAPTGTVGTFAYNLISVRDASSTTCSQNQTGTATITVNPLPVADAGTAPAAQCYNAAGNTFGLSGTATNGTPAWTVQSKSNNAFTVGFSDAAITNPNVTVSGSSAGGTVTLLLTVTSNASPGCGTATSTVTVTVNAQSAGPDVTYVPPTCLETTFKVQVNSPTNGSTYTLRQLSGGVGPLTKTAPADVVNGKIIFEGLTVGRGYRVTETTSAASGSCVSLPTACGDFSSVVGARMSPQSTTNEVTQTTAVKAYPNPFNDKVKFLVTSSEAGNGSLEVYNMSGQKVKTVYTGFIAAGTQTFELSLPIQQVSNLVYILRVGDKKVTGKILQMNR